MGKNGKTIKKGSSMPFQKPTKKKNESASSMRNKQRMWVRNGLREIKAPLVPLSCLSKMHILLQGPLKITLEFGVCFLWWWSNSSRSILTWQTKVIAMLCSLIFACDGLDWAPIDHFETFAGQMSVTKAEIQVGLFQQEKCLSIQTESLNIQILYHFSILNGEKILSTEHEFATGPT